MCMSTQEPPQEKAGEARDEEDRSHGNPDHKGRPPRGAGLWRDHARDRVKGVAENRPDHSPGGLAVCASGDPRHAVAACAAWRAGERRPGRRLVVAPIAERAHLRVVRGSAGNASLGTPLAAALHTHIAHLAQCTSVSRALCTVCNLTVLEDARGADRLSVRALGAHPVLLCAADGAPRVCVHLVASSRQEEVAVCALHAGAIDYRGACRGCSRRGLGAPAVQGERGLGAADRAVARPVDVRAAALAACSRGRARPLAPSHFRFGRYRIAWRARRAVFGPIAHTRGALAAAADATLVAGEVSVFANSTKHVSAANLAVRNLTQRTPCNHSFYIFNCIIPRDNPAVIHAGPGIGEEEPKAAALAPPIISARSAVRNGARPDSLDTADAHPVQDIPEHAVRAHLCPVHCAALIAVRRDARTANSFLVLVTFSAHVTEAGSVVSSGNRSINTSPGTDSFPNWCVLFVAASHV